MDFFGFFRRIRVLVVVVVVGFQQLICLQSWPLLPISSCTMEMNTGDSDEKDDNDSAK